jgi:DNA-binding NtrC family response regulator
MSRVKNDNDGRNSARTLPQEVAQTATPRLLLRVVSEAGRSSDRTIELTGDFFRIGSQEQNDLCLADPKVSRFHAQIVRGKHSWKVTDSGSLNGTKISGVTVRDADLPSPCTLTIGDSEVVVSELPSTGQVEIFERPSFGALYGQSVSMRKLFALLDRLAKSDVSVLVEGESGTGKELVASEIVRRGARADKPFIVVDCGAIAPSLVESQLFGHARGAFTGADKERAGAFEAADGGTIFLDEIGELPIDMQPKLLRVIEAREVRRLGETHSRPVDVRVIAATNRRLDVEVNQGRFREDLYFRLSVVNVRVPPLRDRPEDIELLVNVILEDMGDLGSQKLFTKEVLERMARHDWPGNVRELRNFVERTVVLDSVEDAALPDPEDGDRPRGGRSSPPGESTGEAGIDINVPFRLAKDTVIEDFERRYLRALVEWARGNVSRAARKAKMDRMNLHRLVQRYGLKESSSLRDP